MTAKDAQSSPGGRFWVFHVSCGVWIWKSSQSALLCSVSHVTILFVTTRAMDIWDQASQASVISSGPFRDSSCKFVHRPKNVWPTDASQVQTFQDDLWANFRHFSNSSQFFFLELVLVNTRSGDFCTTVALFCLPTRNTSPRLRMSFHVIRPSSGFHVRSSIWQFFSGSSRDS